MRAEDRAKDTIGGKEEAGDKGLILNTVAAAGKDERTRETEMELRRPSIHLYSSAWVLISRLLIAGTLLTRGSTDFHRKGKVRHNGGRGWVGLKCDKNARERSTRRGRDRVGCEGHECCVNEREVNHSDQTIKMMAWWWEDSYPPECLKPFKLLQLPGIFKFDVSTE